MTTTSRGTTTRPARTARSAAVLALAGAGLGLGLAGTPGSAGAAPTAAADEPSRTTITFAVDDCRGCEVQLHQGLQDGDDVVVWHSHRKRVRHGEVSFTVRSARTAGLQATVEAPWEGHTGYLTTVAFRYAGEQVGERVTFAEARDERRASGCWEGTQREEVTLPLVVREVEVRGVTEKVPGSIAFLKRTQSWLDPVRRAPHGVLGSQDVDACR